MLTGREWWEVPVLAETIWVRGVLYSSTSLGEVVGDLHDDDRYGTNLPFPPPRPAMPIFSVIASKQAAVSFGRAYKQAC